MGEMEQYRIPNAPASMFYIHDFITEEQEGTIRQSIPANRWVSLSHRRLQAVPARLTATNTLLASPLPTWLTVPVVTRFNDLGIFEGSPHGVNHCLINEYLPAQGIMPHEDGGAYHPVVATVSLGGSIVLDVTEKVQDAAASNQDGAGSWRILQEPRSLLVTTGAAYNDTLHGIADVTEDHDLNGHTVANWSLLGNKQFIEDHQGRNERTVRISLTYRDVKKVSRISSKLFGKAKG
ncbi:hypothetical protein LTR36_007411 [Oleoguttula mirabilis]|uniref:Fe2OG dioxygenase domain-containing protein n=1 Tax=Oleoguttula mirabilis TaxID=1507867 RepID=A0AAV9J9Y5_9PEZI|nr:hypothetical protein LTR36_007411 [Oleoguttula mirabilis]